MAAPGRDFPLEPYYTNPQSLDPVGLITDDFFASPGLKGFLPFLLFWLRLPLSVGRAFPIPTWWHLLFAENEVIVLRAPGPPPSTSIQTQLIEGRVRAHLVAEDVNVIRYANVTRVRLYGANRYTPAPRVTFWARWPHGATFSLIYPKGRSNLRDNEKIPYARDLLKTVLPKDIQFTGA